jgi:hypothetical protein
MPREKAQAATTARLRWFVSPTKAPIASTCRRALYLAYKGKAISAQQSKLWERVIVEDFAEFHKAGLQHTMMAEIEKELGISR